MYLLTTILSNVSPQVCLLVPVFLPGLTLTVSIHVTFLTNHSGSRMIRFQYSCSLEGVIHYASPSNVPPSFFLVSALRNTFPSTSAGLILV
jgi:hypothetical protein